MDDCWPPDLGIGAPPNSDPPAFPSGREGTEQIILGGIIWPSENEPLPGGKTTAQSKGKPETEQNICCIPMEGFGAGGARWGRSLRPVCDQYATCADVTK